MTALTDTLTWAATPGATGYTIGVRDTTAPASQPGSYLFQATVPATQLSVPFSQPRDLGGGVPTGVPIACAVQAQLVSVDANGIPTSLQTSDWSLEVIVTLDAPVQAAQSQSLGAKIGTVQGSQNVQPPTLAAPTGVAVTGVASSG